MLPSDYTTQALAYVGDSVYEVCVRTYLVNAGKSHSAELNRAALDYVTAPKQALAIEKIRTLLSDEEQLICRRGRNLNHNNIPKNATIGEYRHATELECLFGYLHLSGRYDRINELFSAICEDKKE